MDAKLRVFRRVVVVGVLLFLLPCGPVNFAVLHGYQGRNSALDREVSAGNLDKARLLVSENWASAEQLFVSYLERAFLASGDSNAGQQAGRLADVFFKIQEYDFARSVVLTLETLDAARRAQLIDIVRDYYTTLERLRVATVAGPAQSERAKEQAQINLQLTSIADRFAKISFLRGQLWTLRGMVNVATPAQRISLAADKVADQLGDELSLLTKGQATEASLSLAMKLRLPRRQATILERMSDPLSASSDRAALEQAANYLERARLLWRTIPSIEGLNYWLFRSTAPRPAFFILPNLWRVYQKLGRSSEAVPLVAEALEISRPFGGDAQAATVTAFCRSTTGVEPDAVRAILTVSQSFGPIVELAATRGVAGADASSRFQDDLAGKALALAIALPDAHERAITLEWYSRARYNDLAGIGGAQVPAADAAASVKDIAPFPDSYHQLLQLCLRSDEVGLTADALVSQARFQAALGNPDAAVAAFTMAIDHAERSGDFWKAARVANNATTNIATAGTVTVAARTVLPAAARLAFSSRAIDMATRANDSRELATAFRTRALVGLGATDQSLRDLQQAVAAAERYSAESGDVSTEVLCLRALGAERQLRGEYAAAVDVWKQAADRAEKASLWREEQNALESIVRAYSTYLGEPGLALTASERLRQLVETHRTEASRVPGPYNTPPDYLLARLYRQLGQPAAALQSYERALTSVPAAPGPAINLSTRRTILTDRAGYLAELGDYEAALLDWEAVLALMKTTQGAFRGGPNLQKASWLSSVARVHWLAGSHEKALAFAREAGAELARDTSDAWVGKDIVDTAVAILLDAQVSEEAIDFCSKYYDRVLARPVAEPVVQRAFLETIALARMKAGRIDEARTNLEAAADIDRNHPTAEIGGLGGSLLALGNLEIAARNYAKAKEHLLAARQAANPYDLNQIWRIERALAVALAKAGDSQAAVGHYERALDTLESVREQLRPEELSLLYSENRDRVYEEHARLLAARALASGQQADTVKAFQTAERRRAHILRGLLATGWARVSDDAMPEQLRRAFDIETRIAAKQALLRGQFALPVDKRNAPLVAVLQGDLKQLQDDHARLLSTVAQGQYRYAAPAKLAESLAGRVQLALGPSRALVEYLVADDKAFAFVVSGRGIRIVPLTFGRAKLREQVQHLLASFRQQRGGRIDLAHLGYDRAASYRLYQAVFAPVRPLLGSASEVVIVADDVLNFLPFDALIEKAPGDAARGPVLHGEFADMPFLLRRYAISYLSSSSELVVYAESAARPPKRLFALANPAAGPAKPAAADDDPLKRQLRSGAFGAALSPLPGAETEVRRIARLFPADSVSIVTGAAATESAYESEAGRAAIVHIAAHGVASDGQPLYSTLVLAPDTTRDGFLQAFEVLRTPLRADLIVLDACETAVGGADWGQGLVGLVAAFQQSGARSVLATLWSIDEATSELMAPFYAAMTGGASTPAALRRAKLQMLERRQRIGNAEVSLAHPFFWAPFILVGTGPSAQRPAS